ncbi:hypothetical protein ACHQM5_004038 [Ranunculus cassubicifolius]
MISEAVLQHSMIEYGKEPVLKNQDQEDDDEILNICDYINFDNFSGEFFADLFVDNDDNNNFSSSSSQRSSSSSSPSSPLSCVEQEGSVSPLSTDESSEGSIWIRQIEDMLLNDDDNGEDKGISDSGEKMEAPLAAAER